MPLVDCPDCTDTTIFFDSDPMSIQIGPDSQTKLKVTDLMSEAYFYEDGFSFCEYNYSVTVISPDPLPSWIS